MKITILACSFLLVFVNAVQTRRHRCKPHPANCKKMKLEIKPAPGFGKRSGNLHGLEFNPGYNRKRRFYPASVLQLTSYPGYVREHESFPGYLQGHNLDKTINFKDRLLRSDWNTNSDQFRDSNINLYPASEYFYPQNIPTSIGNTDYDYPENEENILRDSRSQLFRQSPLSNSARRFNRDWGRSSTFYNRPDKRLVKSSTK